MNSDNPGASLTTIPFDGRNFSSWSRQINMALGANMKLGFIDGSIEVLGADSPDYARWKIVDHMIACWLLNSMTMELAGSFVYMSSARSMWKEILERYNHYSAPMVFQLKQELMRIIQGTSSVSDYDNKLKKCWDELKFLNNIPACTCGFLDKCTCKVLARIT